MIHGVPEAATPSQLPRGTCIDKDAPALVAAAAVAGDGSAGTRRGAKRRVSSSAQLHPDASICVWLGLPGVTGSPWRVYPVEYCGRVSEAGGVGAAWAGRVLAGVAGRAYEADEKNLRAVSSEAMVD